MKKSRCTEEQIIGFLKEAEAGFPIADLCRRQNCLKAKSENYRANLNDNTSPFHEKIIDLFPSNKNKDTAFYEAGNIIAKYYQLDSIPDDDELKKDLKTILNLYDELINSDNAFEAINLKEGDEPDNIHFEDATKFRLHKRTERNARLSKEVKRIHGYSCQACELNFKDKYGEIDEGYIEAHHLEPISELKGKKVTRDPKKDLTVL